jgi:hypothetical protein
MMEGSGSPEKIEKIRFLRIGIRLRIRIPDPAVRYLFYLDWTKSAGMHSILMTSLWLIIRDDVFRYAFVL